MKGILPKLENNLGLHWEPFFTFEFKCDVCWKIMHLNVHLLGFSKQIWMISWNLKAQSVNVRSKAPFEKFRVIASMQLRTRSKTRFEITVVSKHEMNDRTLLLYEAKNHFTNNYVYINAAIKPWQALCLILIVPLIMCTPSICHSGCALHAQSSILRTAPKGLPTAYTWQQSSSLQYKPKFKYEKSRSPFITKHTQIKLHTYKAMTCRSSLRTSRCRLQLDAGYS